MYSYLCSGGLGDIVYSIPIINQIGEGIYYVKESCYKHTFCNQYTSIKSLLSLQKNVAEVKPYPANYPFYEYDPSIEITHDLDLARKQRNRGRNHIIRSYLQAFSLPTENWNTPFLKLPDLKPLVGKYSLIHLTPRWRENSRVNWKTVFERIEGKVYFIGFEEEHKVFSLNYGPIEYIRTYNLLEVAFLINGCERLYCNQSVALSIAQGLGKEYYCEFKPLKTNCMFYTTNEHAL